MLFVIKATQKLNWRKIPLEQWVFQHALYPKITN
jgi:hypothetical protein